MRFDSEPRFTQASKKTFELVIKNATRLISTNEPDPITKFFKGDQVIAYIKSNQRFIVV